MSELSGSAASPLMSGPETPYVVEAVDALLRADVVAARLALIDGAEVAGWAAVAHRLDVAGHALAADAGLITAEDDADGATDIVLLPGLDTTSWSADHADDTRALIDRWSGPRDDELSLDQVWSSLTLVTWLVDRAGYPAQVVA